MAYTYPVVAMSASNVSVTSPTSATFDGITVTAGQRVLLTQQIPSSQNGVWIFNGTEILHPRLLPRPMTRPAAPDPYNTGHVLDNATLIWVTNGGTYGGSVWGVDPAAVITVDATGHTLSRVALPPVQARAATPGANLTLSSVYESIDGVSLQGDGADGADIVLVKDQTSASQNGLYWANTGGAMVRGSEPLVPARMVNVAEGAINAHTEWLLITKAPIDLGTTAVMFSRQFFRVNVKDWGATGDGATDDTAAIQSACASIPAASSGGALVFPPGAYRVGALTVPPYVMLDFEQGGVLYATQVLTVNGPISAGQTQQAFAGGAVWAMTQFGAGPSVSFVAIGGLSPSPATLTITITAGGPLGCGGATFSFALNGGPPQYAATTTITGDQTLPAGTLKVASVAGFTVGGTVIVASSAGVQEVTYTALQASPPALLGCTGGAGALSDGAAVNLPYNTYGSATVTPTGFVSPPQQGFCFSFEGTYRTLFTFPPGAYSSGTTYSWALGTAVANLAGGPSLTVAAGSPTKSSSDYAVQVLVTDGPLGVMTFRYSVDGGAAWSDNVQTAAGSSYSYAIPTANVALAFPSGTYVAGIYAFTTSGPAVLGGGALGDISPCWWGAKGDGVADDTAPIQATINSLTSVFSATQSWVGGAQVVFPQGTFLISREIALSIFSVPLTIRGAGRDVTLIIQTAIANGFASHGVWGETTGLAVTIEDLTLGNLATFPLYESLVDNMWRPNTPYKVGQVVAPLGPSNRLLKCTKAGVSGSFPPFHRLWSGTPSNPSSNPFGFAAPPSVSVTPTNGEFGAWCQQVAINITKAGIIGGASPMEFQWSIVGLFGTYSSSIPATSNTVALGSTGLSVNFATPPTTTISSISDRLALPQATINVASTAGFPAPPSQITVMSGQIVTYSGMTPQAFTGCSGGTGQLSAGGSVYAGYLESRLYCSPPFWAGFSVIVGDQLADGSGDSAVQWTVIDGGCAILQENGGNWRINRIATEGWINGVVFDNTEVSSVVDSEISANNCIWIVNGNERSNSDTAPLQPVGSANALRFERIDFNAQTMAIADSGGVAHIFRDFNIEGGAAGPPAWYVWLAGVDIAEISGMESEGGTSCIFLGAIAPFTGAAYGPSFQLEFHHNLIPQKAMIWSPALAGGTNPPAVTLTRPPTTSVNILTTLPVPPPGTLIVNSTNGFTPPPGTIYVATSNGVQPVAYTGTTPNSFTGCTGGTGSAGQGAPVFAQSPGTLEGTWGGALSLVIEITQPGGYNGGQFRWSSDGGQTFTTGVLVGPSVLLGSTGVTVNFPDGPYSIDNVYYSILWPGAAFDASYQVGLTPFADVAIRDCQISWQGPSGLLKFWAGDGVSLERNFYTNPLTLLDWSPYLPPNVPFGHGAAYPTLYWNQVSASEGTGIGMNCIPAINGYDINASFALRAGRSPWSLLPTPNGNVDLANPGLAAIEIVNDPGGPFNINGIAGGTDGQQLRITNLTSRPMTIVHQDSTYEKVASNRIACPTGQPVTYTPAGGGFGNGGGFDAVLLIYSGSQSRWLLMMGD
jgi:hypothetical protein